MLDEVGDMIGIEYRINLDLLIMEILMIETKEDINEFVNGYQDRQIQF